jgi:pyrroline-5-carboxylate reductase
MPNTPSLVGRGVAAIAGGRSATDGDLVWAEEVLGAVGVVVRVAERDLDAVTGSRARVPAYVFLVAEALIDAGVLVGLSRPVAEQLAIETLRGAAELLASGTPAAEAACQRHLAGRHHRRRAASARGRLGCARRSSMRWWPRVARAAELA